MGRLIGTATIVEDYRKAKHDFGNDESRVLNFEIDLQHRIPVACKVPDERELSISKNGLLSCDR